MGQDVCVTLDCLIAANGDNYARISDLLGKNPAYIQQFIKRRVPRQLNERDRRILARYFNVCESALGGPADILPPQPNQCTSTIRMVPILLLENSKGGGPSCEYKRGQKWRAFDAEWLSRLSAHPQSLSVAEVAGDAMTPTLRPGDEVFVDHSDRAASPRDGIYIIRLHGALMIRRLNVRGADSQIAIISDNPICSECVDPCQAEIVGRVIWGARAFR